MFCPSCGAEYQIELKYCNRCGANLSGLAAPPTEIISINFNKAISVIGTALALVTVFGFIAVIVGAAKLAERASLGNDPIIALIVMGMLTILTTDIFLIRQLSRLISATLSSNKAPRQVGAATASYLPPPVNTARLEPSPSVTENTTRFFEPAYSTKTSDPEREPPRT